MSPLKPRRHELKRRRRQLSSDRKSEHHRSRNRAHCSVTPADCVSIYILSGFFHRLSWRIRQFSLADKRPPDSLCMLPSKHHPLSNLFTPIIQHAKFRIALAFEWPVLLRKESEPIKELILLLPHVNYSRFNLPTK